jgi:dihydroorotate dehydrogenase (fumarate)
MIDLTTRFFGMNLQSPVIAASCGLTGSLNNIRKIAENGAGAVVLKSIFEEEIRHELEKELKSRPPGDKRSDEYFDYFDYILKEETLKKYTDLIRDAKKAVDIPIIASIHCITSAEWISFAHKLEKSGADGLELNLFVIPSDLSLPPESHERFYFDSIEKVKRHVSVPVTVKVSSYFSNLAKMLVDLSQTGIQGLTLFNRFYMPDIDIEKEEVTASPVLSRSTDYLVPLRWTALLAHQVACPLSATTGIHTSQTLIKFLLAGAGAVQVSSVLYKEGIETIGRFNEDLRAWMQKKEYATIEDFKGKVSVETDTSARYFERVQFMKHFGEY